jgi:hypothetical protein
MGNLNNIGGLISTNNDQIVANGLFIPSNFNSAPYSSKMSQLFNNNSNILYTKNSYLFNDGSGQPFFIVNPQNIPVGKFASNSKLNVNKRTDSRSYPITSAREDINRTNKYLFSSTGIVFTLKQTLLQGLQPFNETKIYNPAMPIVAAARPLSSGLISRPIRFIEPRLSGVLGALGLSAIGSIFGVNSNPTPPRGTAPGPSGTGGFFASFMGTNLPGPLPINRQDGGKGLTRGKTATEAYKNVTDYWGTTKTKGLIGGLLSNIGNFFRSNTLIGSLFPIGQPKGTIYKADENVSDLMYQNGILVPNQRSNSSFSITKLLFGKSIPAQNRFYYKGINGTENYGVEQRWAGNVQVNGNARYVTGKVINDSNGFGKVKVEQITTGNKVGKYGAVVFPSFLGQLTPGLAIIDEHSEILKYYSAANDTFYTTRKGPNTYKKDFTKYDTQVTSPTSQPSVKEPNGSTVAVNEQSKIKDEFDSKKTEVYTVTSIGDGTRDVYTNSKYNSTNEYVTQVQSPPSTPSVKDPTSGATQAVDIEKSRLKDTEYQNGIPPVTEYKGGTTEILTKDFTRYDTQVKNPSVPPVSIPGSNTVQVTNELSNLLKDYKYYFVENKNDVDGKIPPASTKLTSPNSVKDFVSSQTQKTNSWDSLNKLETYTTKGKTQTTVVNDGKTYLGKYNTGDLRKQLLEYDNNTGKGISTKDGDSINLLDIQKNDDRFKDRDLIKFWFYDIANENYIPFRATLKSINERYTTEWDNFQYIGNADKVYNYKGFTRSLSFAFTTVAFSSKELEPMWKRINYLMGLSKPSKYFNDKFIVPPLIKLTVGEMYSDQPIVITNIGLTVPDNATWETLTSNQKYNYLHNSISFGVNIAQMPMEADISIDCNLIEKKSPQVKNTNNFGWDKLVTT